MAAERNENRKINSVNILFEKRAFGCVFFISVRNFNLY